MSGFYFSLSFKERQNTYGSSFTYSDTGRILRKKQVNKARYPDGETVELSPTTYTFDYEYNSHRPNAVTKAGSREFDYDASGNIIRMTDSSYVIVRDISEETQGDGEDEGEESGDEPGVEIIEFTRDFKWDEENRLLKTVDTKCKR